MQAAKRQDKCNSAQPYKMHTKVHLAGPDSFLKAINCIMIFKLIAFCANPTTEFWPMIHKCREPFDVRPWGVTQKINSGLEWTGLECWT